jgi:hypothetical protein
MLAVLTAATQGGERVIDFSQFILGQPLPGFRSTVSGVGTPGEWKTLLENAPTNTVSTTNTPRRAVLAQLAKDPADEHFPLLIYDKESFGDFTLKTRFKTVSGEKEQMAGIAFRIQDEKNYYVVRASSLGNTLKFYKFVNGERNVPIGPSGIISAGVWHTLSIECKGFNIRCVLDGIELIRGSDPDKSFASGKIGFWTKSDSISYFGDTTIQFHKAESIAPKLIRDQMKKYSRLAGLRIYMRANDKENATVIASSDPSAIGEPGTKVEKDVIDSDRMYCGIGDRTSTVTLPLHDRNGEVIAAVRVVMLTFSGQTEKNALARAMPIAKAMELHVRTRQDLMPEE